MFFPFLPYYCPMNKDNRILIKILTYFNWILIGLSFIAFYFSIRSDTKAFQYAVVALLIWGVAYLISQWIKKIKRQDEE
jgi:hypothetical protein